MRYRYGVFSEVGFPNDPMYPAYYSIGPETRKNEGCNTTFLVNEEKYQKVSSNSSNNSGRSNIAISRQMVSLCLLIEYDKSENDCRFILRFDLWRACL